MNSLFSIIGIVSTIIFLLYLLFIIAIAIFETIKNKIDKTNIHYEFEKQSVVYLTCREFYLIPTIQILKAYYFEISIRWLFITICFCYKIVKDE